MTCSNGEEASWYLHVEYAVDEDSQIVAVCFTGESEGWLEVRSCRESCNAIFDTARLVLAMGATFRAVRRFSHVKLISDTPVLYQLMLSKDYLWIRDDAYELDFLA